MIYLYKCSRDGCKSTRETDVTTLEEPCGKCGAPLILSETDGFQEQGEPAPAKPAGKPKAKPKKARKKK